MSDPLEVTILSIVQRAGAGGITMGRIVDRVVADGGEELLAEQAVWSLMQRRLLTPHGYACRTIRKPSPSGATSEHRSYEFVLIAWSPERDHQLELALPEAGNGAAKGSGGGDGRGDGH